MLPVRLDPRSYSLEYNRKPEARARQVSDSEGYMLAVSQIQRPLALDAVQELTAIKAVPSGQRPVDYIVAVGKLATQLS